MEPMTRRAFSALLLGGLLAGCGAVAPVPTANPAPTQTRIAELNQLATAVAPTATPAATSTPAPTATATPAPPPPTATVTPPPPTPTATPPPATVALAVDNVSSGPNGPGAVRFIGEVVNPGAVDVRNVRVTIELVDEVGHIVAAVEDSLALAVAPVLKPGGKSVWTAQVYPVPDTWRQARIRMQGTERVARRGGPVELSVEGVALGPGAGGRSGFTVSGRVVNRGQQEVFSGDMTMAAYSADGRLLAVEHNSVPSLSVGQSAPFSRTFTQLLEPPTVHVSAWATVMR